MTRKISTSLARIGVGIAVVCGVTLSSIQIFLDYQDQRQRNKEVINNALHIASAGAAQAAYELSHSEATASLKSLMIQEHILQAEITNEAGDIISYYAREVDTAHSSYLLRALMTQDQTHTVNLFHTQGNINVGELRIVVHTPTIMQDFFSRSVRQLVAGILRGLIVMAILLFFFNRILTRPITEFASQLERVDPRSPRAVEIPESITTANNELSDLAMATNAILGASKDHLKEIEAKQRETMEVTDALRHSERLSVVGKLTGGLAHDFNNILAVTMGSFELLQHGKQLDQEGQELVETGLKASKHGASLTAQLLAYSRRQALNPKSIEIRDFFLNFKKLLRQPLGKNCEFLLTFSEGVCHCFVDELHLETALLNLAINAKDAMNVDGTLTINVRNTFLDKEGNENVSGTTEYVCITVSDDGAGMSEEILDNAFEPYFTTKEVGQGSGLGLSMVHGFVKQSGGHIKIDSDEGQGTSIKIYLPRYDQSLTAEVSDRQT